MEQLYVWYCTNELYIRTVCKVFALPYRHIFPFLYTVPSFFTLSISPHSLLSLHFDPLTSPFLAHPTSLLEKLPYSSYVLVLVLYKGAVHKNCMWGFCSPFSSLFSIPFFYRPLSLYTPPFSTFSPLSTISGMCILVDRC